MNDSNNNRKLIIISLIFHVILFSSCSASYHRRQMAPSPPLPGPLWGNVSVWRTRTPVLWDSVITIQDISVAGMSLLPSDLRTYRIENVCFHTESLVSGCVGAGVHRLKQKTDQRATPYSFERGAFANNNLLSTQPRGWLSERPQ